MEVMLIGGFIGIVAVILVIAIGVLLLRNRIAPVEAIHQTGNDEFDGSDK